MNIDEEPDNEPDPPNGRPGSSGSGNDKPGTGEDEEEKTS